MPGRKAIRAKGQRDTGKKNELEWHVHIVSNLVASVSQKSPQIATLVNDVGALMSNVAQQPDDSDVTSSDPSREGETRESRWQFSIRGVLLLTLVLSAVLMMIAPAIRAWSADRAFAAFVQLAIVAFPTAAVVLAIFAQERKIRIVAGSVIVTVYRPGAHDRAALIWLSTIGMLILTGVIVFFQTEKDVIGAGGLCVAFCLALGGVCVYPQTILYALTGIVPGEVEICENGLIISGKRYVARSRICKWRMEGRAITLLIDAEDEDFHGYGPWQCQVWVPKNVHDEVMEVIHAWDLQVELPPADAEFDD